MSYNDSRVHLKIDNYGAKCIDDYLEYRRIVGDDDGGTLFTPDQYEAYKKEKLPQRINNRLFVSWASSTSQIECKMIGPETKCFCGHRYKQHKTDFEEIPSSRPIKLPCEVRGCKCKSYNYVPLNGSQPIRCRCKHFADDHSVISPNKCKKSECQCKHFFSSFTCGCGQPAYDHVMLIETKDERLARGRPVGHDVPYKAMGGLTGFSSLADGYMRLDESGIGAPSSQFLEQPTNPLYDHPFLKMHSGFNKMSLEAPSNKQQLRQSDPALLPYSDPSLTKEEQDMAYFEMRYQQRQKVEREQLRAKSNPSRLRQTRVGGQPKPITGQPKPLTGQPKPLTRNQNQPTSSAASKRQLANAKPKTVGK